MTRWTNGWVLILVMFAAVGMVSSCARQQNSQVDPKAFSLWVVPF
jgi:hypothetical protein